MYHASRRIGEGALTKEENNCYQSLDAVTGSNDVLELAGSSGRIRERTELHLDHLTQDHETDNRGGPCCDLTGAAS